MHQFREVCTSLFPLFHSLPLYFHAGVSNYTLCYTFSLDGLGYLHLYVVRYIAWEDGYTSIFVDFTFRYRIEYLTGKEEVAGALTQVLMDRLQNPIPIAADNHFLYFIRLSQQDCDKLQPNLEQVASHQRSDTMYIRTGLQSVR